MGKNMSIGNGVMGYSKSANTSDCWVKSKSDDASVNWNINREKNNSMNAIYVKSFKLCPLLFTRDPNSGVAKYIHIKTEILKAKKCKL